MARTVEDHDGDVGRIDALGLGDGLHVEVGRGGDVDDTRGLGAGGDLLHVEDGGGVVHRTALGGGEHGDGVRAALGHQGGAVHRVDGDVHVGALTGADVLAVEQHRGFVLLALTDDDHAVHLDGVDHGTHSVHGGTVTLVLHAASDPLTGRECGGLGHADQLHREVAVRCLHGDVGGDSGLSRHGYQLSFDVLRQLIPLFHVAANSGRGGAA